MFSNIYDLNLKNYQFITDNLRANNSHDLQKYPLYLYLYPG